MGTSATSEVEREFERELDIFRGEVDQAKQFLFAQVAINAEALERPIVLTFLNRTPMLWNTVRGALQQSLFVALGRVFDTDPDVHGLARLLRLAEQNRQMFSRRALALRKSSYPGYADDRYEPTDKQFRALRKQIAGWRAIFEGQYKAIRNRHNAHNERMAKVEELFQGARFDQLEKMLAFLGSVHSALSQAFLNGFELRLDIEPHSTEEMRSQSRKGHRGRTVQEDIVREVRAMLMYAELAATDGRPLAVTDRCVAARPLPR